MKQINVTNLYGAEGMNYFAVRDGVSTWRFEMIGGFGKQRFIVKAAMARRTPRRLRR